MFKRFALLSAVLVLAGCGQMAPLQPAAGQSLPVKPLMAATTPTPDELLTPPPYATPKRVDELIKRSQPRSTDRFDLPPANGGAAPLPAGAGDEPSTKPGPATPE